MYIHRIDDEPLAFAGLWEIWQPKGDDGEYTGEEIRSCTIITGEANETMAPIHDRMPVLLPAVGLGPVARAGQRRRRDPRASCWCRPRRPSSPPTR